MSIWLILVFELIIFFKIYFGGSEKQLFRNALGTSWLLLTVDKNSLSIFRLWSLSRHFSMCCDIKKAFFISASLVSLFGQSSAWHKRRKSWKKSRNCRTTAVSMIKRRNFNTEHRITQHLLTVNKLFVTTFLAEIFRIWSWTLRWSYFTLHLSVLIRKNTVNSHFEGKFRVWSESDLERYFRPEKVRKLNVIIDFFTTIIFNVTRSLK